MREQVAHFKKKMSGLLARHLDNSGQIYQVGCGMWGSNSIIVDRA